MRSTLHYEKHIGGVDRPWLVFLHGAGGSILTWKYQVPVFFPHFNVLLLDLRDHGKSKNLDPAFSTYTFDIIRNDIKQVLDELNISKADFMTLSFGSVLLQDFHSHYPDVVRRVVIAGGIFDCNTFTKACVYLARFFNLFLPYRTMYALFSYLLMPYKRNQLARKIYQKQADIITRKEYLKWLGLYGAFFTLLSNFQKQKLGNRILVVMGGDDYVFLSSAKKFVSSQENATLSILPKVGHICNLEAPEGFNAVALSFLYAESTKREKPQTTVSFDTN